jgi:hypothetical protein
MTNIKLKFKNATGYLTRLYKLLMKIFLANTSVSG